MFCQTLFFCSGLNILHPGDVFFLTEAVILSSNSNFFAVIAAYCNNDLTSSKKVNCFMVFLSPFTLTELSGNTSFLRRVQKVTSVSCNWFISMHVVYFVLW